MKNWILVLIILLKSFTVMAMQTIVTTASAINNTSWSSGDTIVMKNGTWTNQSILYRVNHTVSPGRHSN